MKRSILAGLVAFVACAAGGCGPTSKQEALMNDMVQALSDFASALESVKDDASAREAAAKIDKVRERIVEIGKKAEGTKATKAQNEALEKKFKPQLENLKKRIENAAAAIEKNAPNNPELEQAVLRLVSTAADIEAKIGAK
jgi:peptidoglycan hydrolase CwlO-like protein